MFFQKLIEVQPTGLNNFRYISQKEIVKIHPEIFDKFPKNLRFFSTTPRVTFQKLTLQIPK